MLSTGRHNTYSNLLEIANMALVYLNVDVLDNLVSEYSQNLQIDRVKVSVLNVLPQIIYSILEKHFWQFAIKSAKITKRADGMLQYPEDCLRLVGIGTFGCTCPAAVTEVSTIHPVNKNNSLDKIIRNDDRYLSHVAFTIVNGCWNYHFLDSSACCDDTFDTVFYIHDSLESMKMPYSFKEVCSMYLSTKLINMVKSDPQGIIRSADTKRADFLLYKEIEREYYEFKSRYAFNYTQNSNMGSSYKSFSGFSISPWEVF